MKDLNGNYVCARGQERKTDRFIMPITTHQLEHFISSGIATSWAFLDTGNAGLFSHADHNLLSSENPVGIGDAQEGSSGTALKRMFFFNMKCEWCCARSQGHRRKNGSHPGLWIKLFPWQITIKKWGRPICW